jgi:hypothetical protein
MRFPTLQGNLTMPDAIELLRSNNERVSRSVEALESQLKGHLNQFLYRSEDDVETLDRCHVDGCKDEITTLTSYGGTLSCFKHSEYLD